MNTPRDELMNAAIRRSDHAAWDETVEACCTRHTAAQVAVAVAARTQQTGWHERVRAAHTARSWFTRRRKHR